MTPLELIDQMLAKLPYFTCTENQMRFLRDLVVQNQDPAAVKKAADNHKKRVLARLRCNVTIARKEFESAKAALALRERTP